MSLKAVCSRLGRSLQSSLLRSGARWLALLLATLMILSTTLDGGHSGVVVKGGAHFAVERELAAADSQAPCDDVPSRACHHGGSCASASSCSFCVPVHDQLLVALPRNEPVATAALFVSSPGDVPIQPRPPKLIVTA